MATDPKKGVGRRIVTVAEATREKLHESMLAAKNDLGRAVCPIYKATVGGRVEHEGSGILVKLRNKHWLISAAHVIDQNKTAQILIPVTRQLRALEGKGVITTAPGADRNRDRFDFAIIELASTFVKALGDVRYVTEAEISNGTPGGHAYMAIGYPNSQNKKHNHLKRQVKPRLHTFGATLVKDEAVLRKHGFNSIDHLAIPYSKYSQDAAGERVNSLSPIGMSGGGLVDLGRIVHPANLPKTNRVAASLSAVLIEYRKSDEIMIAVTMETVLNADNW